MKMTDLDASITEMYSTALCGSFEACTFINIAASRGGMKFDQPYLSEIVTYGLQGICWIYSLIFKSQKGSYSHKLINYLIAYNIFTAAGDILHYIHCPSWAACGNNIITTEKYIFLPGILDHVPHVWPRRPLHGSIIIPVDWYLIPVGTHNMLQNDLPFHKYLGLHSVPLLSLLTHLALPFAIFYSK